MLYLPFRDSRIVPADAGLPDGQVRSIHTTTDDEIELNGWHVLADELVAGYRSSADLRSLNDRPLVLFFSGNAANRRYRVSEFRIFTELGADVVVFDYRGYGDNHGSPSERGLAADARASWKFATGNLELPPNRIVLFGESLGGGVAVRLAAEMCQAGTPPAGLILRSTFSTLSDAAAYHYPWLPVRRLLVDRYPSIERVASVTSPLLTVHGTSDRIIPIRLGRRLHDAAPDRSASGVPKQFIELPEADHNDLHHVARDAYRDAIAEFLRRLASP